MKRETQKSKKGKKCSRSVETVGWIKVFRDFAAAPTAFDPPKETRIVFSLLMFFCCFIQGLYNM